MKKIILVVLLALSLYGKSEVCQSHLDESLKLNTMVGLAAERQDFFSVRVNAKKLILHLESIIVECPKAEAGHARTLRSGLLKILGK